MRSADRPAYTAAVEKARALGLARGGFVPDIARHIEIKKGSTMREARRARSPSAKTPVGSTR
jgi:hypothetical protein